MKSVEQHLRDVTCLLSRSATETVPLSAAAGRVLAAPVVARWPLPRFTCSSVDGFAVLAADTTGDRPALLRIVDSVAAGGTATVAVTPGSAIRLMTGGPLPPGADAVVMVEDTTVSGETVSVRSTVTSGTSVRPAGEDVQAGDVVLAAGAFLGAAHLGAAAATGATTLSVAVRPRVVIITTGDELVPAGTEPGPTQLVDSNGPALTAALTSAGAQVLAAWHVSDSEDQLLAALERADRELGVDLVVTAGGISMGDLDIVKSALAPRGVIFERVAMQPGMPQAWGRWRADGPAFVGLPGNPVSALVSHEVFLRPALRAALGDARPTPVLRATLAAGLGSPAGRRQYARAMLAASADGWQATATPRGQGSHLLAALATSNALVVVPEDTTQLHAGDVVDVLPLPGWAL